MKQRPQQREPEPVGAEYGGKWIAWDDDGLKIVASGETLEQVLAQARSAGVKLPGLEFVPPSDRAFIGGVGSLLPADFFAKYCDAFFNWRELAQCPQSKFGRVCGRI